MFMMSFVVAIMFHDEIKIIIKPLPARPTVTFPAAGHGFRAKLYCLMTDAHVCEQLAQGRL